MSLNGAMSAALSGLNAHQRALQIVSANVANAQNPDYTRKTVGFQAQAYPGQGVVTVAVSRATDAALAQDLVAYTALAGQTGVQADYMKRLSTLFGTSGGSADLAGATEAFTSAWAVLQATPDNTQAQADVIAKATALADTINRMSQGVEAIDTQIQADTAGTVEDINDILRDLDRLNHSIIAGRREQGDTVEMEDQRDALVLKLSGLIDVKTIGRSDGGLAVYTAGGTTLVDQTATELAYDGTVITRAGDTQPLNGAIRSGRLAGLLALRADGPSAEPGRGTIDELRDQLAGFAGMFTDTTAGTFAAAYDAATPTLPGELAGGFFVMNGTSLAVNPALLAGTATVKQAGIVAGNDALVDASRAFAATGISVAGEDYSGIASAITATLSRDVGAVTTKANLSEATRGEAQTRFAAAVGVNMDEELANLQVLQNAYAASARVMQAVNQLYDDLFGIMR